MKVEKETIKKAGEKLESRWGRWGKVAVYVVVAVAVALGYLTVSGCTGGMKLTLKSEHGEATWEVGSEKGVEPPVVIPQKK